VNLLLLLTYYWFNMCILSKIKIYLLSEICFITNSGDSDQFNFRAVFLCIIASHMPSDAPVSSFVIDSNDSKSKVITLIQYLLEFYNFFFKELTLHLSMHCIVQQPWVSLSNQGLSYFQLGNKSSPYQLKPQLFPSLQESIHNQSVPKTNT
jgi:hypothetical protein